LSCSMNTALLVESGFRLPPGHEPAPGASIAQGTSGIDRPLEPRPAGAAELLKAIQAPDAEGTDPGAASGLPEAVADAMRGPFRWRPRSRPAGAETEPATAAGPRT
jgi:hypothetical protein